MFTPRKKSPIKATSLQGIDNIDEKAIATKKSIKAYLNLACELIMTITFVSINLQMFYNLNQHKCYLYIHRWGLSNYLPIVQICFVAFALKMHCCIFH